MDRDEFEDAIRETISQLPEWVREAMHNVDVQVLDEPDADLDPPSIASLDVQSDPDGEQRDDSTPSH